MEERNETQVFPSLRLFIPYSVRIIIVGTLKKRDIRLIRNFRFFFVTDLCEQPIPDRPYGKWVTHHSLWNCAYIHLRSARFSEGKWRKRTRSIAETHFYGIFSEEGRGNSPSCYAPITLDRLGARQFHTIAKRSRCNASSNTVSLFPFIYYLETAAGFYANA